LPVSPRRLFRYTRGMPIEIERKFLVSGDSWRNQVVRARPILQGYLSHDKGRSVRVRAYGARAFVTIKGETGTTARPEYEYEIPFDHAREMLASLCYQPLIEKIRHEVPVAGLLWEVDEFAGANAGLVLAEIELESAGQPIVLPNWVGREVTADRRYRNSNLWRHPMGRAPRSAERPDGAGEIAIPCNRSG
jgi:adenylate cyclase